MFDGYVGAEWTYQLPIRVIADTAWHALFAQTLFIPPVPADLPHFAPELTVMECGGLQADPAVDGTAGEVFIGISLARKIVLIVGSSYAGEMKKAVFTVMNYLLPERGVLPMHCAANMGPEGDVALFFGLSGTGKTTLSAAPGRRLIGDDEHGWSAQCVFNIEGGCYAKVIDLDADDEPQIYDAIRFGSILENVIVDPQTGPSTTTPRRSRRTRGPRTRSGTSRAPSCPAWPATPTTCSSSPATPSGSCLRSRGSLLRKPSTTSSPASRPSWAGPRSG